MFQLPLVHPRSKASACVLENQEDCFRTRTGSLLPKEGILVDDWMDSELTKVLFCLVM